MMQDIVAGHRPSAQMLEFLADQFNTANREADYCATLLKLFDVYCAQENYLKAAEALDRAAEIDVYEPGHQKRMEMLKGKIDPSRYEVIASRFAGSAPVQPVRSEEKTLGAGTLQDLMLQAEILVQYGMRNKALERLQRIQQLFPHEEDGNPELKQLYLTAGMTPQYAGGHPAAVAAPATAGEVLAAPAVPISHAAANDVSGFARVPDITRKLNQQTTSEAVLETTASEIGTQWNLARCIVALRKPGSSASAWKEFVAAGNHAAVDVLQPLVCGLHDLAMERGTLVYGDIGSAPELQPFKSQFAALAARSLLVLPLVDGNEHIGVLLLIEKAPRSWAANDVLVFKMISEQVAISLSNAGLRRLVKNLSVTDESSGLLKRASYLDLLMGEIRRAWQQKSQACVLLLRFGSAALAKEKDKDKDRDQTEAGFEGTMQRLGQLVAGNIRQNDLAFRYTSSCIAIVLGETGEKEALMVVEKMRRLITAALGEKLIASSLNAGVAEAVVRLEFDPVDIVTEVINRVEMALEKAVAEGAGKSVALAAELSAAAVA
jgi:GGDEF domain-containing protein